MKKLFYLILVMIVIVSFIEGFLVCRMMYEHTWKRFCEKHNHKTDKELIDELIGNGERIDKC